MDGVLILGRTHHCVGELRACAGNARRGLLFVPMGSRVARSPRMFRVVQIQIQVQAGPILEARGVLETRGPFNNTINDDIA